MTIIIKSENWESVTAPAIPAGWTLTGWDSTNLITTTAQKVSGVNSVKSGDNSSNVCGGYWNTTTDGNCGDSQVTMSFYLESTIGTGQSFGLICRAVNPPLTDCYKMTLNVGSNTINLSVYIGGVSSTITSQAATLATGIWYTCRLKCLLNTVNIRVQRASDSNYLTSANTWQAASVDCIVVTDSTPGRPSGTGYGGFFLNNADFPASTVDITYADDFLFESLGNKGSFFPFFNY